MIKANNGHKANHNCNTTHSPIGSSRHLAQPKREAQHEPGGVSVTQEPQQ